MEALPPLLLYTCAIGLHSRYSDH